MACRWNLGKPLAHIVGRGETRPMLSKVNSFDDDDDYEPADLEELFEPSYFDCRLDRNGNCGKVGSEECDFECPYRLLIGIAPR
jgi:hypothetical protein